MGLCRALVSPGRTLLSVYSALVGVYRAPWIECRALLLLYRALLIVCKSLLGVHCALISMYVAFKEECSELLVFETHPYTHSD